MEKITGETQLSSSQFVQIKKEIKNIFDFKKKIEGSLDKKTTDLLQIILAGAVVLDGSDLHLEPQEKKAEIRIRIDGILQKVTAVDKKIYENLLNRIKLLAGIKLNIANRPQDGRFSFLLSSAIEIRVSTLPAEKGETVVLRILNPKALIEIESLGLRKDLLGVLKKEITRPHGMIIVTGPTGSGKTTTLYAFLKKVQKPEIKIITIEDPIEYHLDGISQTQVKKGEYDFASGLKSVMRQDPDVILVGEVRDLETAKTALQAALTGHLVLTTLHTNDAAGTVARLTDLGANLANIGPAVNIIIAQRLIRKVCKKCSILKKVSTQDLQKIRKELKGLPKKVKIPKITTNLRIQKTKGCNFCNFTGYKDRVGIFELLLIDDEMEKFLLKNPSIATLRETMVKKGMTLIKHDGIIKVLEGQSTLEELERIMGE